MMYRDPLNLTVWSYVRMTRCNTMPFRFMYLTADISAPSRSLDSVEIYTSCSVHKCECHSMFDILGGDFVEAAKCIPHPIFLLYSYIPRPSCY